MSICDFLAMVDRHTTSTELFSALIAITLANTFAGVTYRAKKNNGDLSFIGKPYFTFELLNWNKYGVFAFIQIAVLLAVVVTIAFLPALNRYCIE